jgi:hypothetical protein
MKRPREDPQVDNLPVLVQSQQSQGNSVVQEQYLALVALSELDMALPNSFLSQRVSQLIGQ